MNDGSGMVRSSAAPVILASLGLAWLIAGRPAPHLPRRLRRGGDEFGDWYEDEFGGTRPDELRSRGAWPLPTGPQDPDLGDRALDVLDDLRREITRAPLATAALAFAAGAAIGAALPAADDRPGD